MTTAARSSAPRRSSGRRLAERLSVDDWTEAALGLLMRDGVAAVKISTLCAELNVTKGSFYWHFESLDDLLNAMAERWVTQTQEAIGQLSALAELPPKQRLVAMTELLMDDEAWRVERALREWARADERIARALGESDLKVFELVQHAIVEQGLDPAQARLRAGLLVYAGIGFAHGHSAMPRPTRDDVVQMLDILLRP